MEGSGRAMRGRKPRCLILSPTRELAMQTANEATMLAPELSTLSVYGGTAYDPQLDGLRAGTDIVVGTPGRWGCKCASCSSFYQLNTSR